MADLLEMLGRGLGGSLGSVFQEHLCQADSSTIVELEEDAAGRPESAEINLRLGLKYLRSGRLSNACERLERVLSLGHQAGEMVAQLGLACAKEALGRSAEALDHLESAMRCGAEYPEVLTAAGMAAERADLTDRAIGFYERALVCDPLFRQAHERLAAIHLRGGRRERAAEQYRQLTYLFPDELNYHLTLANLLLVMDQAEEAIAHYQHALLLDPENWEADQDLAVAFEQAGLYVDAVEHLETVCLDDSDDPAVAGVCVRLGDLYGRLGQDRLAVASYQRAIRLNPRCLEASVKLGTHHLRMGRYADAARCFNRSVEINDQLLTAYAGLGIAQAEAGQDEQARQTLDLAAGLEPNSSLLFSEMAKLQLRSMIDERAARAAQVGEGPAAGAEPTPQNDRVGDLLDLQIERYRKSVAVHPERADLRYRFGLLLRHRGRYRDAIEQFRHAVNINPTYVKALIKLGLALHECGQEDEAIAFLRRALEIKPNYVDLHYRLGLIFADRKNFNLALEHFEHALAGSEGDSDFHANLRLALQNMGLVKPTIGPWPPLPEEGEPPSAADSAASAVSK